MLKQSKISEQLLLSELQVLLAEKRTYFAILRTGLAILTVPFTFMVFLIATASYHRIFEHVWLGASVITVVLGISASGAYLSYRASAKITKLNAHIRAAEKANKRIDDIMV